MVAASAPGGGAGVILLSSLLPLLVSTILLLQASVLFHQFRGDFFDQNLDALEKECQHGVVLKNILEFFLLLGG